MAARWFCSCLYGAAEMNVKCIAPGITSNGLQSPTAAIFVQSPNSCMLFWITASAESTALGKYSGFV